ncbi:hydrolase [Polymorphobacter sp.]|uniref:hydrolase n=1 Tax=Polymorphobacter sp. TaxID=1909290 RepID=UPI003F70D2C1
MTGVSPLTPAEAAALAPLTGRRDAMVGQVLAWASINSGSRNLPGLAAMADALAQAFAPLGGTLRRVPAAPARHVAADGALVAQPHGDNLQIVLRPEAPVQVLLTGHMDTVFAVDSPFQHCRWLSPDVLNGPGVADMKGGIAVMLAALLAFEASDFAPRLGWQVVLNADEEVSSPGSAPLLAEAARAADVGLTFEPALADGTLAGARRGSGNFAAHVRGRAAHAGRNPQEGRNALVAAADLALRLAALTAADLSVNPARIDGGGPDNIVPESAVLRWNMRPATPEAAARGAAAVQRLAANIAADHDVAVDVHGHFARPPKPLDDHQRRLFDLVRDCGTALSLPIAWQDTGGVCDGNNLAATGLSIVDTLGPRGGSIHSADEFLCVDSLEERARLATLILCRLAQHGWTR